MFILIGRPRLKMYIGAGIIIHNSKKQVLLVCDARSGRWGFPKGHPEVCDKKQPINTAVRECFEETGMRVVHDYIIESANPKRIGKRLYFTGILLNEGFRNYNLDRNEIQDVRWWSFEDLIANESILNSDLRAWLNKKKRTGIRSPTLVRSPAFGATASVSAPAPVASYSI
jgi:8-oxo-dGTP pyrophosphatase MutT (NUDIX family)